MAIISSNIGDSDFSPRRKELRVVDSINIAQEKNHKNETNQKNIEMSQVTTKSKRINQI